MNKKTIIHAIMITAVVITAFVAAALTPVKTSAGTREGSAVVNIAKVDFENRTAQKEAVMILDNEIPMAEVPAQEGINMHLWWIVVTVSAVIIGIVMIEARKVDRS